jgi:putative membrane protein
MLTRVAGKLIVNALALIAAALIVPRFKLDLHDAQGNVAAVNVAYVLLVAAVFAVINTFIRPIAKIASLPLNLLTLGLFGFALNAVLVLLLTFVVGLLQSHPYAIRLAQFPPDLSVDAIVAAVLGGLVISIVSTIVAWFVPNE